MDIYDKIKEILEIARNARQIKFDAEKNKNIELDRIIWHCNQILIDHQTQQALEKLENEPKRLHP